jgi:hypothetical protein
MITEVYIGNLKSKKFDYDKIGEDPEGTYPEIIGKSTYDSELFWDIMKEDKKQSNWGCWVWKLNKTDLIAFLNRDKYKDSLSAKHLSDIAFGLNDKKEYLLVAFEDIISPPWD